MSSLPPSLVTLIIFTVALIGLAFLSRQISIHIQTVVFYLTRSQEMPTVILFVIFLPGVFVHESAHWAMARLLGLKTGKFRVWPKRQGQTIGMGSVTVQQGGVWRDSLVGLAPLLVGSLLITLIAQQVFAAYQVTHAFARGDLITGLSAFWAAMRAPDGFIWAYLLFVIANAMMPSPSDRAPVKPVILYLGTAAVLYFFLGLPLAPLSSLLERGAPAVEALTGALVFTIVLDMAILIGLFIIELLLPAGRAR